MSSTSASAAVNLALSAREVLGGDSLYTKRMSDGVDVLMPVGAADLNLDRVQGLTGDKFDPVLRGLAELGLKSLLAVKESPRLVPGRNIEAPSVGLQAVFLAAGVRGQLLRPVRGMADRWTGRTPRWHPSQVASWRRVIRKIRPRYIMGIGLDRSLCTAAGEFGVPTVEIQHGILGSWAKELWWGPSPKASEMPDLMITWDRYYSEVATSMGIPSISLGYPLQPLDDAGGSAQDYLTGVGREGEGNRQRRIVVTLSYDEADAVDPVGLLTRQTYRAVEAIRAVVPDAEWDFRLHPVSEGAPGTDAGLRWIEANVPSARATFPSRTRLLEQLRGASLHVTSASSSVLEAALLGVPSLALDPALLDSIPPKLVDSGVVTAVNQHQSGPAAAAAFARTVEPWTPDTEGGLPEAIALADSFRHESARKGSRSAGTG